MSYPAPNFTGTVYLEGGDASSVDDPTDDVVSPWGWISIESFTMFDPDGVADNGDEYPSNFQWVAGGNTNQDGEFSMRVSDGDGAEDTYLVRFYSSGWGGTWKPPVEALVTFDASDEMTSWVYRGAEGDPQDTHDVYFDHVAPNLTIEVTSDTDVPITEGTVTVILYNDDGLEIQLSGAATEDGVTLNGYVLTAGNYHAQVIWADNSDNVTCTTHDFALNALPETNTIDANLGGMDSCAP